MECRKTRTIFYKRSVSHIPDHAGAIKPPAWAPPFPMLVAIAFRLSSHPLSPRNSCIILSRLPCRISLMLTLPMRTSLSKRKSNRRKSPSRLSSLGSLGNAESGTGGDEGRPLIDSARRKSPSPSQSGPEGSVICRFDGRWLFAHSMRPSSTGVG